MNKTIKMVAVINGEEKTVGRCHPGQARLLRKQGIAEWQDGKIVFNSAPKDGIVVEILPPITSSQLLAAIGHSDIIRDAEGMAVGMASRSPVEWKAEDEIPTIPPRPAMSEHVHNELLKEIAEIDPEGLINDLWKQWGDYPDAITCRNATDYFGQMRARREAGHDLDCADDPKARTIGFVDADANLIIELPLRSLKQATDRDYGLMGEPDEVRKAMVHYAGRAELLNVEWNLNPMDTGEKLGDVPEDIWETPQEFPLAEPEPVNLDRYLMQRLNGWAIFKEDDGRADVEKEGNAVLSPEGVKWYSGYFRRSGERMARLWVQGDGSAVVDTATLEGSIYQFVARKSVVSLQGARERGEHFLIHGKEMQADIAITSLAPAE